MFRALRKSPLSVEEMFPVTVGASSKQTLANWHLLEPSDVIQCLAMLNGDATSSNIGAVSVVDGAVPELKKIA
jgi:trehalose 6-phosphate synthase/phosphatase